MYQNRFFIMNLSILDFTGHNRLFFVRKWNVRNKKWFIGNKIFVWQVYASSLHLLDQMSCVNKHIIFLSHQIGITMSSSSLLVMIKAFEHVIGKNHVLTVQMKSRLLKYSILLQLIVDMVRCVFTLINFIKTPLFQAWTRQGIDIIYKSMDALRKWSLVLLILTLFEIIGYFPNSHIRTIFDKNGRYEISGFFVRANIVL